MTVGPSVQSASVPGKPQLGEDPDRQRPAHLASLGQRGMVEEIFRTTKSLVPATRRNVAAAIRDVLGNPVAVYKG